MAQNSNLLFFLLLLSCMSFKLPVTGKDRPTRPNVVLILADDLGWQDVTCYDIDEPTPMETPNIDSLAKRGVLFRQGYSPAPTCAPTRYFDNEWPSSSGITENSCGWRASADPLQ
jgi:hypothetical protein